MSSLPMATRFLRLGYQLHKLTQNETVKRLSFRSALRKTHSTYLKATTNQEVPPQLLAPLHAIQKKEYVCPSRTDNLNIVILDKSMSSLKIVDCPTISNLVRDIITPERKSEEISDPKPSTVPKIEARNIMKIRRRKMKKHLLGKLRKRLLFKIRKQKMIQMKKKKAKFNAKLSAIMKMSQDFDAEEYVQRELDVARRGGYYINIMR